MQIRTGMRSSWVAAAAAVLVTGLLALLPSGCGGGEKAGARADDTWPGGDTDRSDSDPNPTAHRTF